MNEAELLFTEALGCGRAALYLEANRALSRGKGAFISSVLKRRIAGEPLQYILGKSEFMGLEFRVGPGVFIPRPETELLVEKAVELGSRVKVLDLGTGSGCIAISLAKFLSDAEITAMDISPAAIGIARDNAIFHGVAKKIRFNIGDLFLTHDTKHTTHDIIVSNPPYIPSADIDTLQPELGYEPRLALDGGKDGMDFYRAISGGAGEYLKQDGFLIIEIGYGQSEAVKRIFEQGDNFTVKEVIRDYNNIDRVMVLKKDGQVNH